MSCNEVEVDNIVERISSILENEDIATTGFVLAELLSAWIASQHPNNDVLLECLLQSHVSGVRRLIQVHIANSRYQKTTGSYEPQSP